MRKIIYFLLIIINIICFGNEMKKSEKEIDKEIVEKILGNMDFTCEFSTKNLLYIEGKNFSGYINEKGKFHGRLTLNNPEITYCILEDKWKYFDEERFFSYDLEKGGITRFRNNGIFQYSSPRGVYNLFHKIGNEYVRESAMLLFPATGHYTLYFFENYYLEIDEKNIK